MKTFKPLPTPKDSAFGRKTLNPLKLFDRWIYNKFRNTTFYDWYDDLISTPIFSFIDGIKNLFKWFRIIWMDRNWDHQYILEIIQFKLINQRKYLIEKNRFEGVNIVNRDITICLNLIERIKTGYYEQEYYGYYKCDYKFIKLENSEFYSLEDTTLKEEIDKLETYIKKYKNQHKKLQKLHPNTKDKLTAAIYLSRENHLRARKLLFKILEERIEWWWD